MKENIINSNLNKLKENVIINENPKIITKFYKKNMIPFKEISHSKIFNSPSSKFSDFSIKNIKNLSKNKYIEEDNDVTIQNYVKILSGKNIVKENPAKFSNNSLNNKNIRSIKVNKVFKSESPNSSINIDNIKDILNINNYKGKFCKMIDGSKITENCILNHKKKSKFYILKDDNIKQYLNNNNILRGLCSKCAVKFANFGILCEEILNDLAELRKNRWNNFNLNYNNLKIILANTEKNLKLHNTNLLKIKNNQIDFCIDTVNNLIKKLKTTNDKIINYINIKYDNELNNSKNILKSLKNFNLDIDNFNNDIEKNYNIIIKKEFNQKKFNSILNKYDNKINEIFKFNDKVNNLKSNLPIIEMNLEYFYEEDNKTKVNLFKLDKKDLKFKNDFSLLQDNKKYNNSHNLSYNSKLESIDFSKFIDNKKLNSHKILFN